MQKKGIGIRGQIPLGLPPISAVPQSQNKFLLLSSPVSTASQQRLCFLVKVQRFSKFQPVGPGQAG